MNPLVLAIVTALVAIGAASAAAHYAVRRVRAATGLPSPLAVLHRHPEARVRERRGERIASIPGQSEGLLLDELAAAVWERIDGKSTLVAIAQRVARRRAMSSRASLVEIRRVARSLKRSLLAMESSEWRLIHTHRLDVFSGAEEPGILEHRPSESLIIHAASFLLSPEGEFEPWRGGWRERRSAARAMERHASREAPLEKAGEHFRRGWKLCRAGSLDDAEGAYLRASRLAPGWANPHYQLGYVRLRLRRYDDAVTSLRRAEEISPGYYMVREYLDHARRLQEGELDPEAFQLFDRANAAGLDDPDLTIRLATEALRISPEFPSARLILARAYQKKKQLDRALGELSRTIRMNPDKATLCHALLSRGSIFHAQGRREEALREWEKVIEIDGSATATRSALATLVSAAPVH